MSKGGSPLKPAELRATAERYRELVQAGIAPTRPIAAEEGKHKLTIKRRLDQAEKRGFSKPGERLDESRGPTTQDRRLTVGGAEA